MIEIKTSFSSHHCTCVIITKSRLHPPTPSSCRVRIIPTTISTRHRPESHHPMPRHHPRHLSDDTHSDDIIIIINMTMTFCSPQPFPYHLADYVCRIMRISPFKYYIDLLYDSMRQGTFLSPPLSPPLLAGSNPVPTCDLRPATCVQNGPTTPSPTSRLLTASVRRESGGTNSSTP